MPESTPLIEFENVSLVRGTTQILDRIDLTVPSGQNIAIVGPNGSGKSSLLKLLMRFFYPSVVDGCSGSVRILGREEWNVWDLRSHLGFISSEIDHHFCIGRSARLTALEAILTGFSSSELEPDWESITSSMQREANEMLKMFHMLHMSSKPVGHMSTGERRRILLARAMVTHPQALILDEPTSGLDLTARHRFLAQVNKLATDGTQIVLVTHHLEEILPCIHRTVLLKQGRIDFDGPIDEAITNERISGLYDASIRVDRDSNGFHVATL
ncbi:MAG: ATP-binding cassette domain-containing protein [Pirellula sp.]